MRMFLSLTPDEAKALGRLAERERRDPRQQAALLLRQALEARGVLPPLDSDRQIKMAEVQPCAG
jgi:hypothetical protein